jgi:DNA-directed RNA polymerase subunit RPC12/RpoP
MANVQKTKLGKIKCRECGEKVYVFQHDGTGTLSYKCQECDSSWHAAKGTTGARNALTELGQAPAPAPAPEPAPAPAPTPAPAPEPEDVPAKTSAGFWS